MIASSMPTKTKTPKAAPKHPIQPTIMDGEVIRFKANPLVRYLLDWATPRGCGMNELAMVPCSPDDRQQFAQLIGYSLSGYGELSYVTDQAHFAATTMHKKGLDERDARIAYLEGLFRDLKDGLREPLARLYEKHPDDMDDPDASL